MYETSIDTEHGIREKVYASSSTHHGEFRNPGNSKGSGIHVTAVIVVSASGLKAPPFFFISGKRKYADWFEPLLPDVYCDKDGIPHKLCENQWFPDNGVHKLTENGSMEMDILAAFIGHFNSFVRQFVHPSQNILLTLDGHSSRNGFERLRRCMRHNIDVVQAPANTSHVLQPCDKCFNKKFKDSIRETKSELDKMALTNTKTVKLKLMLGVIAHDAITGEDAKRSFRECGLFPLNPA